jgi:ABC-type multidrug transport system fused ATPase/permease subunit
MAMNISVPPAQGFRTKRVTFLVLAVTSVLAVVVSILCLSRNYFIIFQNLYYFPIIIACLYYMKRGFVFSTTLAIVYFLLTLAFTRDAAILLQAAVRVVFFLLVATVITYLSLVRKRAENLIRTTLAEKEIMANKLQSALAEIKTLSGLVPICAWCKKIRDDKGYWQTVEQYVSEHSQAEFTHSMCPECAKKYFDENE